MTREEFEDWLEERTSDVLDSVPQEDASPQIWVERLYAGLRLLSKTEKAEAEDDEDLFDDEEDDDFDDEEDEDDES
jgi:hypothetical protein